MEWWKQKNGILQIYPRSYKDSDSDGIGDIRGIIEKLPYIKGQVDSLGIDAIWLSPFFTSPMKDFGYDVADYCGVDPIFGTLSDFKELLEKAHRLDIAVMIDIVPGHTSDQHPWFVEALANPDSPRRDYYVFRHSDDGPPNNWLSVFGGSAWQLDDNSGEYYLHHFLKEQPNLNWSNPDLQEEFRKIIRFWCDLGVDGFRADAVRWMSKDPELRDDTVNPDFNSEMDPYGGLMHDRSRYGANLDKYLRVMTSTVKEYDNKVMLFEDYVDDRMSSDDQIARFYAVDPSVAAPFNFRMMDQFRTPRDISSVVNDYERLTPDESASIYCLGNHDKPRLISRVGRPMARVLATIQLTLPGVPVIYYGDEIGMINGDIKADQIKDTFELRVPDKQLGRDPNRTPMQWSDKPNSGFSSNSSTWLPVNDNFKEVNVQDQQRQTGSIFELYKRLLSLRKQYKELRTGELSEMHVDDEIYAYKMSSQDGEILVVANLGGCARDLRLTPNGEVVCRARTQLSNGLPSQAITRLEAFDVWVISYAQAQGGIAKV